MNLLERMILCQEDTLKNREEKKYKRGATIYNKDLNKFFYVEITTAPNEYAFTDGKHQKNLSIDVYDTNIGENFNDINDVHTARFVDCVYSPEKILLSDKPIANVSGMIWGPNPTIDSIYVCNDTTAEKFLGKSEDYTRKGIGKMCMQLAEEIYALEGYHKVQASRNLTRGAKYLSSKMKDMGAFGKWICDKKYGQPNVSNGKAGKEFLKACGYRVDRHYLSRYATKNIGREKIVEDDTASKIDTLPLLPKFVINDYVPGNIKNTLGGALSFPKTHDDLCEQNRLLSKNIASISCPDDDVKIQIDGIGISIDQIRKVQEKKLQNNEMIK